MEKRTRFTTSSDSTPSRTPSSSATSSLATSSSKDAEDDGGKTKLEHEESFCVRLEVPFTRELVHFAFPIRATVDQIKTEIFKHEALADLVPSDWLLGTQDEVFEVEFLKIKFATRRFVDKVAPGQELPLILVPVGPQQQRETVTATHIKRRSSFSDLVVLNFLADNRAYGDANPAGSPSPNAASAESYLPRGGSLYEPKKSGGSRLLSLNHPNMPRKGSHILVRRVKLAEQLQQEEQEEQERKKKGGGSSIITSRLVPKRVTKANNSIKKGAASKSGNSGLHYAFTLSQDRPVIRRLNSDEVGMTIETADAWLGSLTDQLLCHILIFLGQVRDYGALAMTCRWLHALTKPYLGIIKKRMTFQKSRECFFGSPSVYSKMPSASYIKRPDKNATTPKPQVQSSPSLRAHLEQHLKQPPIVPIVSSHHSTTSASPSASPTIPPRSFAAIPTVTVANGRTSRAASAADMKPLPTVPPPSSSPSPPSTTSKQDTKTPTTKWPEDGTLTEEFAPIVPREPAAPTIAVEAFSRSPSRRTLYTRMPQGALQQAIGLRGPSKEEASEKGKEHSAKDKGKEKEDDKGKEEVEPEKAKEAPKTSASSSSSPAGSDEWLADEEGWLIPPSPRLSSDSLSMPPVVKVIPDDKIPKLKAKNRQLKERLHLQERKIIDTIAFLSNCMQQLETINALHNKKRNSPPGARRSSTAMGTATTAATATTASTDTTASQANQSQLHKLKPKLTKVTSERGRRRNNSTHDKAHHARPPSSPPNEPTTASSPTLRRPRSNTWASGSYILAQGAEEGEVEATAEESIVDSTISTSTSTKVNGPRRRSDRERRTDPRRGSTMFYEMMSQGTAQLSSEGLITRIREQQLRLQTSSRALLSDFYAERKLVRGKEGKKTPGEEQLAKLAPSLSEGSTSTTTTSDTLTSVPSVSWQMSEATSSGKFYGLMGRGSQEVLTQMNRESEALESPRTKNARAHSEQLGEIQEEPEREITAFPDEDEKKFGNHVSNSHSRRRSARSPAGGSAGQSRSASDTDDSGAEHETNEHESFDEEEVLSSDGEDVHVEIGAENMWEMCMATMRRCQAELLKLTNMDTIHRFLVLKRDFLDTEGNFTLNVLGTINREYYQPLVQSLNEANGSSSGSSGPIISKSDLDIIFGDFEEFYQKHSQFYYDCVHRWQKGEFIGTQILNYANDMMKNFSFRMVDNNKIAIIQIQKLRERNKRFQAFLQEREWSDKSMNMDLKSLLTKPIGRFAYYRLMMEKYLAHLPEEHPQYRPTKQLFDGWTSVLERLSTPTEEEDLDRLRLAELHAQRKAGVLVDFIKPGRQLLRRGNLNLYDMGRLKRKIVILCNDLLVLAKRLHRRHGHSKHDFRAVEVFSLVHCSLVDLQDTAELRDAFSVLTVDGALIFSADSPTKKQKWMHDVRRVVDAIRFQNHSKLQTSRTEYSVDFFTQGEAQRHHGHPHHFAHAVGNGKEEASTSTGSMRRLLTKQSLQSAPQAFLGLFKKDRERERSKTRAE